MPPLSEEELRRLNERIPCPLPGEAAELFRYARGFQLQNVLLHGGKRHLSEVDLSGLDAQFGLEQIFLTPCPWPTMASATIGSLT
jgi:hypothetical protein